MRRTLLASAIVAVTGGTVLVGGASADTIFFDDFDRANSWDVGNAWAELEGAQRDVGIRGNKLRMRGTRNENPGAAVSRGIDSGENNFFKVSFDWATSKKIKNKDSLRVSYAFGNPPPEMDDIGSWADSTMSLSTKGKGKFTDHFTIDRGEADGQLYIMVWSDIKNKKKKYKVDDLTVEGLFEAPELMLSSSRISRLGSLDIDQDDDMNGISPVPVPASLPLMFAALGGMAFMRRRKSKS